jgi:hypothetical protein
LSSPKIFPHTHTKEQYIGNFYHIPKGLAIFFVGEFPSFGDNKKSSATTHMKELCEKNCAKVARFQGKIYEISIIRQ